MSLYAIDEVHNVDRWGRSHNGVPAFRPAWSRLGSERTRLFKTPRTLALTATAPPFMIPIIIDSLKLHPAGHRIIQRSLNRSNICYAARPLVGAIHNLDNYSFLVPSPTCDLPSTILFCDNKDLVMTISSYLNERLSPSRRKKHLVRPYHGDFSDEYRQKVWGAYKKGEVRILIATSSAGTVSLF